MILTGSTGYWSTGIVVRWNGPDRPGWGGHVDFLDDGFVGVAADDADAGRVSTEGRLRTRYFVRDGDTVTGLRVVIDTLLADAARLGITFGGTAGQPCLYYDGDSENEQFPPPDGWRELLTAEAERIGWGCPYEQAKTSHSHRLLE